MTIIRPATGKLLKDKEKKKPILDENEVMPQSDIGKRAQKQNKENENRVNKKMGGGKVGKPIKYEVGGMVKPAYMRNR